MNNCWKILGIPSNSNEKTIKEAYRNLVKKYHPDTVQTPEKKRKYTIKCSEINNAYKEALKNIADRETIGEVISSNSVKYQDKSTPIVFQVIFFLIGLFFLGLMWFGINKGIDLISSLEDTNPIKVFIMVILTIGISILIGGFVLSFTINLFLLGMFKSLILDWLLLKLNLEKHEDKILWVLLVLVNTYLFYGTQLGYVGLSSSLEFAEYYNLIWKVVGAYSLPSFLLYDWILSFVRYNSVKNKVVIENIK